MTPALQALENLQAGNRRFVAGEESHRFHPVSKRRSELVSGQNPQAIILGCADSRVPAELVFDQGLGDLFVTRVAGNIAASSPTGSIEFAADRFGTRLVVVLGHSNCGAVLATLEQLRNPGAADGISPDLASILVRLRESIAPLLETDDGQDDEALLRAAVRANIRATAHRLRTESAVLNRLHDDGLLVVGAEYSLASGEVDFFDGLPGPAGQDDSKS